MKFKIVTMPYYVCLLAGMVSAQAPVSIDFTRDVMPILRQNCIGCHGPSQQMGAMRLDRKSSATKAFSRRIVPGSSANSFVYIRTINGEFGQQMPPTGPLKTEQVAVLKQWIDQGAEWPDALANEADLPPPNVKAVAMVEALRNGDLPAFQKFVDAEPKLLNSRGPEGSTPFMYAVLYADAGTLARLLKQGADPNKHNDVNATALMWAASNLEKTRLLLDRGAEVNVRSDDLRTALMIAARTPGAAPIVKLLLDRGANPNPNARPETESSPLSEAATLGDATIIEMLINKGGDAKAAGQPALMMAAFNRCYKCLDLLSAKISDPGPYTGALQDSAILADLKSVGFFLDHGANVNAFDALGRTPLMYAAVSDALPLDFVKLLIARGADVNAKSRHPKAIDEGLSVLDIAKMHGDTPIVQALVKAGAKGTPATVPPLKQRRENTIQSAIEDSLPLLQRADASFASKAGCISCHNNSLTAMTVGEARKHGFRIDEQTAAKQVNVNVLRLETMRDSLHQSFAFPVADNFGPNSFAFVLLGLAAENYKSDLNTDAVVMYLKSHQMPDGQWPFPAADTRPPLCSNYIGQTVISMRALQLYAPKVDKAGYQKSIQRAAKWLTSVKPVNNEDLSWRLLGLAWAGSGNDARKAMQDLLATQRADGGWSDIPSMESSAYSTGKSLVALKHAGLPVTDAAYQRGVKFLLATQQIDGSWYVKSRALSFQPYFDAGYPHGFDQWISAAGANWATMALSFASAEPKAVKASR